MGYFKDGVMIKIFLLIVFVIIAIVSLMLVVTRNFDDVNTRYKDKLIELNSTFENLTATQKQLNKSLEDIQVKSIKEADLQDKYGDLKDEKTALEKEISRLNGVVSERDAKIKSLNFKIGDLEEEIDDLNAKISKLNKRLDCFEDGKTGC